MTEQFAVFVEEVVRYSVWWAVGMAAVLDFVGFWFGALSIPVVNLLFRPATKLHTPRDVEMFLALKLPEKIYRVTHRKAPDPEPAGEEEQPAAAEPENPMASLSWKLGEKIGKLLSCPWCLTKWASLAAGAILSVCTGLEWLWLLAFLTWPGVIERIRRHPPAAAVQAPRRTVYPAGAHLPPQAPGGPSAQQARR